MDELSTPTSTKKSNKGIILGVVLIFLLVIAGMYFLSKNKATPANQDTTKQQSVNQSLPKEVTVELTDDGFSPNTVTIGVGAAVRWVNKTDGDATVNSADHPTHRKYKELNLGVFKPDATVMLILERPGTYTYHNHFSPEQIGTIVVQ